MNYYSTELLQTIDKIFPLHPGRTAMGLSAMFVSGLVFTDATTSVLITAIATLFTTIIDKWFSERKTDRIRAEDRKEAARIREEDREERRNAARHLAELQSTHAEKIISKVDNVAAKVDGTTVIVAEAIEKANNTSVRIEDLKNTVSVNAEKIAANSQAGYNTNEAIEDTRHRVKRIESVVDGRTRLAGELIKLWTRAFKGKR